MILSSPLVPLSGDARDGRRAPLGSSRAGWVRSAPPADGRRASRGPSCVCRPVRGRRAVRIGPVRRPRNMDARPSCRCIECYFDTSTQSRVHGRRAGSSAGLRPGTAVTAPARGLCAGARCQPHPGTPAAPPEGVSGCEGASRGLGTLAEPRIDVSPARPVRRARPARRGRCPDVLTCFARPGHRRRGQRRRPYKEIIRSLP